MSDIDDSFNPETHKESRTSARRNLQGYIPPVNHVLWKEIGLGDEQINELEELLEEADVSNMLVNELMARMLEIVNYQKDIAMIYDVSPTIVSKRLRAKIGVTDRVQSTKMDVVGKTEYLLENEQLFPYTEKLRDLFVLFGVHGTVTNRILNIYISNITRYDTPIGFYDLLRNLNFGKKRAILLTKEFFNLEVFTDDRRKNETEILRPIV